MTRFGTFIGVSCFFVVLFVRPSLVAQPYLLETAIGIGPGQVDFGIVVSEQQFVGARFHVPSTTTITRIGAHVSWTGATSGVILGAVVALTGGDDFPDSIDLVSPDVRGVTLLTVPRLSADVGGAVDLVLEPGWYGVVFGEGLFGTGGNAVLQAVMPNNGEDVAGPSYFSKQGGFWTNGGFNRVRMFVEVDGAEPRLVQISNTLPTGFVVSQDAGPEISSDGTTLAFALRQGSETELVSGDSAGSSSRTILSGYSLAVSGIGEGEGGTHRILFIGCPSGCAPALDADVYVINSDGSG